VILALRKRRCVSSGYRIPANHVCQGVAKAEPWRLRCGCEVPERAEMPLAPIAARHGARYGGSESERIMPSMPSILVVDDDVSLARLLAHVLQREGYTARVTHDAQSALASVATLKPDLIVLDVRLPDASGETVLRHIRRTSPVPVIILSGVTSEDTIISCLESGADDYVVKPFTPRQLLARIQAVLRRTAAGLPGGEEPALLAAGPFTLDRHSRSVTLGGQQIRLTPTEFGLMELLLSNAGRVVPFDQLVRHVWGIDAPGNESLVRIHMSRLRKKLVRASSPEAADRKSFRNPLVNYPRIGYGLALEWKTPNHRLH